MKSVLAITVIVVTALAGAGRAGAQTQPTTAPSTQPTTAPANGRSNGNGQSRITMTGAGMLLNFQDASIDVVLGELSTAAGFIVVKEVKPEGRVTLVSKQPVKPDEAVSLLNTVLRNAGYAAIQQDRILKIVNKDQAKRLNIPVRTGSDPEKIAKTDELITQVIPLRFADATQLKNDLQPMVNTEADFASNASSNALVITDTSANVRRIVEIVAALDTSVADAVNVKVFQLRYANAANAARLINDVFGQLDISRAQQDGGGNQGGQGRGGFGGGNFGGGNFGGGGGGPGAQFRQFMQQQFGGGRNQQQRTRVTAGSDERTNSVVVTGPTDTLEIVATVIRELDANPAAEETVFVYRLRNSQALNIESVLNSLFNGTSPGNRTQQSNADILRQARANYGGSALNSSNNRGTGGGMFGGGNTGGGFGTNRNNQGGGAFGGGGGGGGGNNQFRLTQAMQQAASDLAGQVTIIADVDSNSLLVRTTPGNYERVRFILEELDKPVQQVLIKVLIAEVTHDNGYDIGTELSILNLRSSGNGQDIGSNFNIPTLGANATGLIVQILETNFQATIRALETAGKLDVLSRPYILASDNQLASITVGQEVPFVTNTRVTDTGQTINTIEYSDIGILLDVIPHVNPDGLVIMDVAPEISALTNTTVAVSEGVTAPIIAKRAAQSRVGVRTGQTVVIGGLMEDRVTQQVSKVPILGDIPIIGAAFKRTVNQKTKTELLIFLTPHVAVHPDALPGMTRDEVQGTKLLPDAVAPGQFEQSREGMKRGDVSREPSTQPAQSGKP